MDIIKDPEFRQVNAVFHAEIAQLKREGKAKTEHKLPINNDDIKKLYENGLFNLNQPDTLQNKVFLDVISAGLERTPESEGIEENWFFCQIGSSGAKYDEKVKEELTKNRRAGRRSTRNQNYV